MLKNKKGSLQDIIFAAVVLLFFGIVVLFGYKISTEFDNQIQANDVIESHGKAASTKLVSYYPGVIDNTFLFFTVALSVVTLVLAALVRIHPIFIPFYFLGLVIIIFLSGLLSNIYQEMASDTNLISQANDLTFISNILNQLPFIVGIFGMVLMIVMYKLWSIQE